MKPLFGNPDFTKNINLANELDNNMSGWWTFNTNFFWRVAFIIGESGFLTNRSLFSLQEQIRSELI